MKAIYPLFGFNTNLVEPIQIGDGLTVSKTIVEVERLNPANLSEEDRLHIQRAQHCLIIDKTKYKPEQASLLFVLSCRILKPTKVFLRYRIDTDNNAVSKIRDDYPFVPTDAVTTHLDVDELRDVSTLFVGINTFRKIDARTSNASYFIGLSYRSRKWLEALLFNVCALETLTSSSVYEKAITQKFVDRLYFFVGYDKADLRKIYNIRSELVHGRYLAESNDKNLENYLISEEVCRSVFKKIIMDQNIMNSFKVEQERMRVFGG